MNRLARYLFLSFGFAVLITSFNNCSPSFDLNEGLSSTTFSSQAKCEAQLLSTFKKTYYPFLSTNCNSCHSTAQGSKDLRTAFAAFDSRGEELIDYQSTHAHGGNNFNSDMQVKIDEFKSSWEDGQDTYLICMSSNNTGNGLLGVHTIPKSIPNIETTLDNNNWVKVEWDLEEEVEGQAAGRIAATFEIEAKLNRVDGVAAGLLLRNPTMQLKAEPNILVSGLMIHIDNREQTAVTTYASISKIVSGTMEVKLTDASGSAYAAYPGFSNESRLAFQFSEISETNSEPDSSGPPDVTPPLAVDIPDIPIPDGGVTFTQLNTSNSLYRVFNRTCNGCHNANSGRLNLTNYEEASAAATLIIERMNSTTSPMPPSGILRQNDRDIVKSWVEAGTPK